MIYNKVTFVMLTNVIFLQCSRNTMAYTQISTSGSGSGDNEGPKIYKAVNFDLLFPTSFNSSENVISTTPETFPSPKKTTTSVVGQPYYPLPQPNKPTALPIEKQQGPTIFVTPAPTTHPTALAAVSNEAGIRDTQQNMNSHEYHAQVVAQNAINMQQKQDNNKAEKDQQPYFATGRAVDYHTSYPFGQVITPLIKTTPRPVYRKPVTSYSIFQAAVKSAAVPSNVGKIISPQAKYQQKPPSKAETDKLYGKGKFRDRFSPSEGVASHAFKSNNDHTYDHSHNYHNHAASYEPAVKTPSATNTDNLYVTPSNLYAFPPNNVNYPSPSQDTKDALPSGSVSSYSWPASGLLKNSNYNLNTANSNYNPYQYNGPVSADYLPPANEGDSGGGMDEGKNNEGGGDGDLAIPGDDSVGVLPASAMDQGTADMNGGVMAGNMASSMDSQDDNKSPDENSYDTEKEYPTPPPNWLKEHPESAQTQPHHDHHPKKPDIDFAHYHDYQNQPDIFSPDHYHHSIPSYPSYPTYQHYPEVIYDDHHHHDHKYVEPSTTTEAPPQEPRVKKYSYFYIGRKLWYIPLYFTVWFSFYVLWLILKSIARHKVNLPNHYVSRRNVDYYDSVQRKQEVINHLTASVLDKIDKFKRKYMI